MGMVLWSVEGVPIKVTWDEWFDHFLSKWMESMRNEWNECIEVNRGKMSDLKDLTLWTLWESPYGWLKVSLSKWLDLFVVTKSFQNEWNRWDLNELKWIEVNRGEMSDLMEMTWNNPMEVTWVNLMGKSLRFENECPYRFDLIDLSEKALCSVEWMSLWEWLGTTLWESPYGRLRVSLSKWLEWSQWESPYQNDQIWWDLS